MGPGGQAGRETVRKDGEIMILDIGTGFALAIAIAVCYVLWNVAALLLVRAHQWLSDRRERRARRLAKRQAVGRMYYGAQWNGGAK